ncbi:MAG TPA: hypothetical protein VFU43_25295 [Streptosporangiaceae bacterium]|nr:hypothetical protein [Streptosporangiaceae bacterium]
MPSDRDHADDLELTTANDPDRARRLARLLFELGSADQPREAA